MKFVGPVNSARDPRMWDVMKSGWKVKYKRLLFMNSSMNSEICSPEMRDKKKNKKKKTQMQKQNATNVDPNRY